MKLLNTAVIGAGAIHGCHVNALRQLPNVALRALADGEPRKINPLHLPARLAHAAKNKLVVENRYKRITKQNRRACPASLKLNLL